LYIHAAKAVLSSGVERDLACALDQRLEHHPVQLVELRCRRRRIPLLPHRLADSQPSVVHEPALSRKQRFGPLALLVGRADVESVVQPSADEVSKFPAMTRRAL
jgi:hypothetical protein